MKSEFWLFCPNCETLTHIEAAKEVPLFPDHDHKCVKKVACSCGHVFFGIEKHIEH